ncbi:MAG: hypothetical protein H7246_03845 [Phycisphaerae bacterium]|nr:hypothetical protein [Saprospiraceae bacterium]
MQKYIRQLTTDIRSAARPEAYEPTQKLLSTSIEDHFAEVEAWLADELPQERIGEILGLEAIQFPPVERLNRNQLRKICEAFEQTMQTYNVSFDMPKRLPWKMRYQLLVSKLEDSVIICDEGFVTVEFCEYDPSECPFGSRYCTCKQYESMMPKFNLKLSERAKDLVQHINAAQQIPPNRTHFHLHYENDAEDRDLALLGKPIYEWLNIDIARFPANDHVGYDDTYGITEAIIDLFPEEAWSWIVDASLTERYETCVSLLKVKATYDYAGVFYTNKQEMDFFERIFQFYFDQRERKKWNDDWPF